MEKKANKSNKPNLDDRNERPTEKANRSGATWEPIASDAIKFLRGWNLKALSVLALLADYGGAISGSGSLKILCGNGTDAHSDLDIYMPAVKEAAQDAIHVLKSSGIRWKNFLSDRIKEVLDYRITIIPYWAMYETADMYRAQGYTASRFGSYLRNSLSGSKELVKDFVDHFCRACLNILDNRAEIEKPDDTVWVYSAEGSRFSSVPSAVSEKIKHIFEALESGSDSLQEFNGQFENETGDEASAKLKASWEKEGYHHELLQKYMNGRVMKERRQYSHAQVYALVNESLNLESPNIKKANITYDSRFRILHGTLPDGRNLQLIFVPTSEGGILHTILKFYASHVMSFVSGTMAAHLYYSTAKERLGMIWNFKGDPRQLNAMGGIRKYEIRGWSFYEADSKTVVSRHAGDEHVKFISLEDCYITALREQNANMILTLPPWWRDYFSEREVSFRTYRWREDRAKINTIQRNRSPRASCKLLKWVHGTLAGHKDVVSSKEWERRNDERSMLDLWCGGVRITLPPIPRAERYTGLL